MNLVLTPSELRSNGIKFRFIFKCPKCQVTLNHRMHRSKVHKIFFGWLPLKKYRCLKCLQVTYVVSPKSMHKWSDVIVGGHSFRDLVPQRIKLDSAHSIKMIK